MLLQSVVSLVGQPLHIWLDSNVIRTLHGTNNSLIDSHIMSRQKKDTHLFPNQFVIQRFCPPIPSLNGTGRQFHLMICCYQTFRYIATMEISLIGNLFLIIMTRLTNFNLSTRQILILATMKRHGLNFRPQLRQILLQQNTRIPNILGIGQF